MSDTGHLQHCQPPAGLSAVTSLLLCVLSTTISSCKNDHSHPQKLKPNWCPVFGQGLCPSLLSLVQNSGVTAPHQTTPWIFQDAVMVCASLAECIQDPSTRMIRSSQVCSRTDGKQERRSRGGMSACPSLCSGRQRGSADPSSL